ncbi:MAG: ABC transporter substrate-binding protein [Alphaproteobacteria bacterium]|nr:ABC transporter substrate-binding protein [Alphaproteobacteria bacterium]
MEASHGVRALLVLGAALWTTHAAADPRPQRIVSMNLCTDQLLMRMVEPERIVSISYLSEKHGATPPELASVLSRMTYNRGLAEEVLMMRPDLVLAGAYSTLTTVPLLRRVGIDVAVFQPENSFEDMRANIRKLGNAVGEPARAEAMIASFDTQLANLTARIPPGEPPVYADISANYNVAGRDTLFAAIVHAGGFRTLGETLGFLGFRDVSLEDLAAMRPDLVSLNRSDLGSPSLSTEALNHPVLRRLIRDLPQLDIPASYTVCANPLTLEAVRLLVDARSAVDTARNARRAGSG